MKKIISLFAAFTVLAVSSFASVSFNGQALKNAPSLSANQVAVYLVFDGTSFDTSFDLSDNVGDSLFSSSTYGSSYTVIGNKSVTTFGDTFLSGPGSFNLTGTLSEGDAYAVVVFESSTTTLSGADTYRVWTDSTWTLPADGNTYTFGTDMNQLTSAATLTAVVPEPSTYAMLAGVLALGYVMIRRRR